MRQIIIDFVKKSFVRNVVAVASGTAAAQAITLAFTPFITRLYGPEIFGLQGLFMSVVTLLATVAALSYPLAIVLPKNNVDAFGLAKLSICIGIGMALLTAIALTFFGDDLFNLLNAEAISSYAFLIPVAMFVSVLSTVVSQWLIRKKAFSLTARYVVFTSLLLNSVKTGMGVIYPTAMVLIVTNLVGTVIGAALTYLGWRRLSPKQRLKNESSDLPATLMQLANRYKDFPFFRTPQNLINTFSESLPVILLSVYFGTSAAGQYTLAISALGVPTALIGGSVMSVFYPRINEALHKGENVSALIIRATAGMAATGALPFLVIMITGPFLFEFVFGEVWRVAGTYAQWLSIWLFLQCINKPSVSAIPALGLQGGLLIYEVFSTGTKILALWIGFAHYHDALIAVALFSLFGSVAYIWLIFWVIRQSRKHQHVQNGNGLK